jgi:hypothetical protein
MSSSEWMKVMLDEIARKRAEALEARAELQRRGEAPDEVAATRSEPAADPETKVQGGPAVQGDPTVHPKPTARGEPIAQGESRIHPEPTVTQEPAVNQDPAAHREPVPKLAADDPAQG